MCINKKLIKPLLSFCIFFIKIRFIKVVIVLLRKTKEARIPPLFYEEGIPGYRDTGIINLGNEF